MVIIRNISKVYGNTIEMTQFSIKIIGFSVDDKNSNLNKKQQAKQEMMEERCWNNGVIKVAK